MRGCLFVLVLAAAVLGGFAWFGSPALASAVIEAVLDNAGYHAATTTITATSDPPPKLLLGRADRVEIDGTDVDFRTFHANRLQLTLTDVNFVARTAGKINGQISGAELTTTDPVNFTRSFELKRYFVWKPENKVHPYECLDRFGPGK